MIIQPLLRKITFPLVLLFAGEQVVAAQCKPSFTYAAGGHTFGVRTTRLHESHNNFSIQPDNMPMNEKIIVIRK